MGRAVGVWNGNSAVSRGYDSTPLPAHLQASIEEFKNACEVLRLAGYQPANFATGSWAEREAAIIKKADELLDADKRTVEGATTHALKVAARACGCMTCSAALYAVETAVKDYQHTTKSYERRWARSNRRYFIQQLREALASRTIKHSGR